MTQEIETLIDGRPFLWQVEGEFTWGCGGPLCQIRSDPLLPTLGPDGYQVIDLPAGTAELIKQNVTSLPILNGLTGLERYHEHFNDVEHLQIIERSRDLRFDRLGLPSEDFARFFAKIMAVPLSPILPKFGSDIVQLRINRPGSTDYNPPHRDGALLHLASTLNVWIPVAGVDGTTSLPIVPGSQAISEEECWQTLPGGASMGGNPYRVPAIGRFKGGPLEMMRAPVRFGQALLFTPYLIHGLAFNQSKTKTRMALEMRFNIAL